MKRRLVIATTAAAVLVGGGTWTAAALSGDDTAPPAPAPVAVPLQDRADDRDDDGLSDDDRGEDGRSGDDRAGDDKDRYDDRARTATGSVTAARAAAAALAHTSGTVDSVDLDDDGGRHWEVEILGRNDRTHEIRVDARTGAAEPVDRDDDSDDADDRSALRAAKVDAGEAGAAALRTRPGSTVTSVEFDEDGPRWEVDLRDGKGAEHEVTVDARTAAVGGDKDDTDDDNDD